LADKRICVIGCGVTGLTTGVVLAHLGHRVRLVETDDFRLSAIAKGEMPFQEPDLPTMLARGIRARRIYLGDDIGESVSSSDYIFIAVRMPASRSGSANLSNLKEALRSIGECPLEGKIVVMRKTAQPGMTEGLAVPLLEKASGLKGGKGFGIAVNPAFLTGGRAVEDCLRPSRIIVGSTNRNTASAVMKLYDGIDAPKLLMDLKGAETAKLASNCFLAAKISCANEIANLCEGFGVDSQEVLKAAGLDPRIGSGYMGAGLGFGGAGLPVDLSTMISAAKEAGMKPELLKAVRKINDRQPLTAISALEEELGGLRGKRIAILGLAYKAGVDDIRNSRAFPIAIGLLSRGSKVVGYDPNAQGSFIKVLPGISYASSAQEALLDADACIIQTEEAEFARLNGKDFDLMRKKIVVDGRRVTSPTKLKKYGVTLRGTGLGSRQRKRVVRR
jgi:UDPglucose 6-dehydrogenase